MKKRWLASVLGLSMAAALLPVPAFAQSGGKALELGTGSISGYDGSYDYLYMGTWESEPLRWRVLDTSTNTGEQGLFVLTDELLYCMVNPSGVQNGWQGSSTQAWCSDFYTNSLASAEQQAVLPTTKSDAAFSAGSASFAEVPDILNGDKVFFLSAEEASNGAYGFTDDASRTACFVGVPERSEWWLRSESQTSHSVGAVSENGAFRETYPLGAGRPAMNLNVDSVLLTSPAAGGKTDDAVDSNLATIPDYDGNEWKLTLVDSSRNFSVAETEVSGEPEDTVQVTYIGAGTGDNEYVSALILDAGGQLLYYGHIAQNSESGAAELTIPADLAPGSYTLEIFSEQCNGDYYTDYASQPATLALNVQVPNQPVDYLDYDAAGGTFTQQTCSGYTAIKASNAPSAWTDGWYVVKGNVTISDRIRVEGDVHLVLTDGATLNAQQGIEVAPNAHLTVYAQSEGDSKGTLDARNSGLCPAIGNDSENNGGDVTINGGNIVAIGDSVPAIGAASTGQLNSVTINGGSVDATSSMSTAIGADFSASVGMITINGGDVNAQGGTASAGIGSGYVGGKVNVTINGGNVTATGGHSGAGIGCGINGADSVNVLITGGQVEAVGDMAAGIGGNRYARSTNITISGGLVTATGDSSVGDIGGTASSTATTHFTTGENGHAVIVANTITDTSDQANWNCLLLNADKTSGTVYGTVETSEPLSLAEGGQLTVPEEAALTVSDMTVPQNAVVEVRGSLTNNGTITNNGSIRVYGNYAGTDSNPNPVEYMYVTYLDETGTQQVYRGDFTTLTGTETKWTDGWYVVKGNVSISSQIVCRGNVNLILTDQSSLDATNGIHVAPYASLTIYAQSEGDDMGILNAFSNYNSGIGGSMITEYNEEHVELGSVTIHGGNITAAGGRYCAGIGSSGNGSVYSDNATGLNVTITGGKVKATGGSQGGAGIGSGADGAAGTVTITGGTVTAIAGGSRVAAGIGVGANGGGVDITITGGIVDAKGVDGAYDIGEGNGSGIVNQPATFTTGSDGRAVIYADSIVGSEDTSAWNCLVMNHDLTQGSVYGNFTMDGELTLPDDMQFTVPAGSALTVGNMSLSEMANLEISGTLTNTGTVNNYGTIRVLEGGGYVGPDSNPNAVLYMHVPYLDEDGNLTYADDVRKVASNSSMLESGWYMLSDGDVSVENRLQVVGDVHLILTDGCHLQANGGISVNEGNSLTIYAQSDAATTMGSLTATAAQFSSAAGIGAEANTNSGTVTINGGKVSATGDLYAAGIGGSRMYGYGSVIIRGGLVEATAGEEAAGLGGGMQDQGGSVFITGGQVSAKGDGNGAAIGAGSAGNGGDIVIQGGIVTAQGAFNAAIGGYDGGSFSTGTNGNAVIFATNYDDRDAIGDRSGEADWNAVILEGKRGQCDTGRVYGQVTRAEGFTVPEGCVLTILAGASLTMQDGAAITNEATVEVQLGGSYTGSQPAPNPIDYEIGWDSDGDGDVDANQYYAYGETPVYEEETPEKAPDAQYTYQFTGWSPNIAPVQAATLYTAQFTASVNEYKVAMPGGEGYTVHYTGSDTVKYGDTISFTVELADGYTATDAFAVKANDAELTADENGTYSTKVTADTTVTVEGVADVTAPDVTITWKSGRDSGTLPADDGGADPAFTVADSVEITITATDAGTGVQSVSYQLEGEQPVTAEGDSVTFTIDKDFAGRLQKVTAADKAGNTASAGTSALFVVEVSAPTKPVVDTAGYTAGSWATEDVTLTPGGATTVGTIDHYEYSVDNGRNWTPMTGSSLAVTENTTGITYTFRAVSALGKQGESSDAVTVKRDKAEPVLTLSAHTDAYLTDDTVELAASVGVSGIAKVEAQKDGGDWQDITDTYAKGYVITENGTYTFRLTNGAGKAVQQSLTYDKLDASKPVVTLDTHGYTPGTWATDTVTITATATQNVAPVTLQYKVDKGEWQTLTGDVLVTEDTTGATYTFRATSASGVQSEEVAVTVKRDSVAPDGSITVAENTFKKAINQISFGLFFNKNVDVTITGTDATSGVQSVEYLRSESILTEEEVQAAVGWLTYTAPISETAEDAARFVYYVRVTDNAGHTTWFGADGVLFDTTAPSIQGVADGGVYYTTQKVTVQDVNLAQVTVNGTPQQETTFTLPGNRDAVYTVEATDKAGNTTTLTLTMKPLDTLGEGLEGLSPDKVTSADKDKIEEVLAGLEEQQKNENLTDEEKQQLEDLKAEAEDLLDKIEQTAQAGHTDNTDKVENVTPDTVKPDDKENLEAAKEDMESALENFGGNMTEEEKNQLEEALDRVNQALESLAQVEAVEEAVAALPDTVEPDDTDTETKINAAKQLYDDLTEHEKTLVSTASKDKLDSLLTELLDYRVIEGDKATYVVASGTNLTVKANGPLSKFTGLLVDGTAVDPTAYTAVSGSTIVTLQSSYLDTLSVGQHSLTFLYRDGRTAGTLTIQPKPATPTPVPTPSPTPTTTQTPAPTQTPAVTPAQTGAPTSEGQATEPTPADSTPTPAPTQAPGGILPQTGDPAALGVLAVIVVLVAAAIVVLQVLRRRKGK